MSSPVIWALVPPRLPPQPAQLRGSLRTRGRACRRAAPRPRKPLHETGSVSHLRGTPRPRSPGLRRFDGQVGCVIWVSFATRIDRRLGFTAIDLELRTSDRRRQGRALTCVTCSSCRSLRTPSLRPHTHTHRKRPPTRVIASLPHCGRYTFACSSTLASL